MDSVPLADLRNFGRILGQCADLLVQLVEEAEITRLLRKRRDESALQRCILRANGADMEARVKALEARR